MIDEMRMKGVACFLSGMGKGADIHAAEAVIDIRGAYPQDGIQLIAVVPYEGQADLWSKSYRERYFNILAAADEVTHCPRIRVYHKKEHQMRILNILKNIDAYKRGQTEYYSVIDFHNAIKNTTEIIETEDLLIVPFYLSENITYEIYQYELNIRVEEKPCFVDNMLRMTSKHQLEDIDKEILSIRQICDIEIIINTYKNIRDGVSNYIDYLLDNEKLKYELRDYLGEYDDRNLYFAVY
jgi:uncharacterized phage-like protein YoqJ